MKQVWSPIFALHHFLVSVHLARISHKYSDNLDNLSRHLRPQLPSPCRFPIRVYVLFQGKDALIENKNTVTC